MSSSMQSKLLKVIGTVRHRKGCLSTPSFKTKCQKDACDCAEESECDCDEAECSTTCARLALVACTHCGGKVHLHNITDDPEGLYDGDTTDNISDTILALTGMDPCTALCGTCSKMCYEITNIMQKMGGSVGYMASLEGKKACTSDGCTDTVVAKTDQDGLFVCHNHAQICLVCDACSYHLCICENCSAPICAEHVHNASGTTDNFCPECADELGLDKEEEEKEEEEEEEEEEELNVVGTKRSRE